MTLITDKMNLNENVKMPSKKNYIIVSKHFVPVDELYSFCRVTRSDENCHAKTIELKTKNYACPALLVSVFLILIFCLPDPNRTMYRNGRYIFIHKLEYLI